MGDPRGVGSRVRGETRGDVGVSGRGRGDGGDGGGGDVSRRSSRAVFQYHHIMHFHVSRLSHASTRICTRYPRAEPRIRSSIHGDPLRCTRDLFHSRCVLPFHLSSFTVFLLLSPSVRSCQCISRLSGSFICLLSDSVSLAWTSHCSLQMYGMSLNWLVTCLQI